MEEGDFLDATISMVCAIPFVKDGVLGLKVTEEALKDGSEIVKAVNEAENIGRDALDVSKADFYVMPSGQAVPSTGYRYISENAPYLDELNKTMVIPGNPTGTYFSFDKFDVASPGKLHVPHDASLRGSFDTLQIIDDIRVPYGNWGKANYLEPITTDFPEFGPGGATQAITNQTINLEELTKLPEYD